jgi:hypothetical protein
VFGRSKKTLEVRWLYVKKCDFVWSNDKIRVRTGPRFYFHVNIDHPNINVVLNWFEELKQRVPAR